MNSKYREIDHIVYAVPNLEDAMLDFEKQTGIKSVFGGRHLNQGTKNALVNIGNHVYLEFITVDLDNKKINSPRWMGIDLIEKPQITRWSIKATDIDLDASILKQYNSGLSTIHKGQRITDNGQLLNWKMTLPLPSPKVELIPFCLDWNDSDFHPCDQLPVQGELIEIIFHHPDSGKINKAFAALNILQKVQLGANPKIEVKLNSPKGEIIL